MTSEPQSVVGTLFHLIVVIFVSREYFSNKQLVLKAKLELTRGFQIDILYVSSIRMLLLRISECLNVPSGGGNTKFGPVQVFLH